MPKQKASYEQSLAELESIIGQLEESELPLENALALFEKGVGLLRTCDTHLKSAEGALRELVKGENGTYIEKKLGISLEAITTPEDTDE